MFNVYTSHYFVCLGEPYIVYNFTDFNQYQYAVGVDVSKDGTIFVAEYFGGAICVICPE